MAHHFISADYILPLDGRKLKDGVLVFGDNGEIVDVISDGANISSDKIKKYEGVICPGFVNVHCHSELSYLRGLIPEHTGLPEFIQNVQKVRNNFSREEITASIDQGIKEMKDGGIVAVGDICNTAYSIDAKNKSEVKWVNFIEAFGFNSERADIVFDETILLKKQFESSGQKAFITPHSPYSVSAELFRRISDQRVREKDVISIHNQENDSERLMLEKGGGELVEMLHSFGLHTNLWKIPGMASPEYFFNMISDSRNAIFVHNTFTLEEDIQKIKEKLESCYWCLCPNANFYIENTLPDVEMFRKNNLSIVLGTDSLASNKSLSILAEIKTLSGEFKNIPIEEMLEWACLNGAKALGIEGVYGSFQQGKKPGILLIDNQEKDKLKITENSRVIVIA